MRKRRHLGLARKKCVAVDAVEEALERRGNAAEALLVYDRLRIMLSDELGIAPSQTVQSVYRRLLGDTTPMAPSTMCPHKQLIRFTVRA